MVQEIVSKTCKILHLTCFTLLFRTFEVGQEMQSKSFSYC
jgi:hypothetical protein